MKVELLIIYNSSTYYYVIINHDRERSCYPKWRSMYHEKIILSCIIPQSRRRRFLDFLSRFPECLTQGDDMAQAYEMAVDALGLALVCREEEGQPLPGTSDWTAIIPEPDSFLAVIEFDMLAYKKRTDS